MLIKNSVFVVTAMLFLCCKGEKELDIGESKPPLQKNAEIESNNRNEKKTCIDAFKKFRELIYLQKKNDLKQFFTFPIESTEIRDLIFWDDENADYDPNIPFTELDFDKYYKELFSQNFIKSFLKVKSQELFEKGYYTTPKLTNDNKEKYFVIAEYDESQKRVSLSFITEYYEGQNKVSDSAVIYYFRFDDECKIKFEKLMLAG